MFDRGMCVCGFASVCLHAYLCAYPHEIEKDIERRERKAKQNAGRDDAKSTGWYKSVTTGPSRQSPLQETQIKADLSSQDLFHAVPTSSLDPVAILFLSVLRSVSMGDEAPELSHAKI